jgi:SAM-dependent methyltransferase
MTQDGDVLLKCDSLVHIIHDSSLKKVLNIYAKGILIDIGCGEKPYQTLTKGKVIAHIGLDHPGSLHSNTHVDLLATAYQTGIEKNSVDTILSTVVIEHLERPQEAIKEMFRILKPGGYMILTAPLFWHIHEEPRDFYRYTKYGLKHLLTNAGFDIIEIKPLSGFIVTFSQELIYFLKQVQCRFFQILIYPLLLIIQYIAFWLNRWDHSYRFTWAYLAVCKKNGT